MTATAQMLETYPKDLGQLDRARLQVCAESCRTCEQACRDLLATLG